MILQFDGDNRDHGTDTKRGQMPTPFTHKKLTEVIAFGRRHEADGEVDPQWWTE